MKIEVTPIPGYNGQYSISRCGQIWSHRWGRFLKTNINDSSGYRGAMLAQDGVPRQKRCDIHRLLAITFLGLDPTSSLQCDHRDRNILNNSLSNLRLATASENQRNASLRKDNRSGIRGVSWFKASGKWQVQIRFGGKQHYLGYFEDINEAAAARKAAEVKYHKEFMPTDGGVK